MGKETVDFTGDVPSEVDDVWFLYGRLKLDVFQEKGKRGKPNTQRAQREKGKERNEKEYQDAKTR